MRIVEFIGIFMGIAGLVLLYKYNVSPLYKKGSALFINSAEENKKRKIAEQKQEAHFKKMNALGFWLTLASMLVSFWVRIIQL